jgi:CDP-glucose 4,6-dehydratase
MEFGQGSLESVEMNPEFWLQKKVLVTGHTGFKGSWLSLWLQSLGAQVIGYALPPPTKPSLYELADIESGMTSIVGDVRDLERLRAIVQEQRPEIVFHTAAQSLVRASYADPAGTYATNVLGTVHVLESVRLVPSVRAVVIVTSDKCYENQNEPRAYRETDRLGGADPYSNSKACAELVTAAFRESFFTKSQGKEMAGIASVRAGNVIGGGDWAADRLIPDVIRAVHGGQELMIRNPRAVRPWQHVLDPLCGYLMLAEKLHHDPERFSESWNFGPDESETWYVSDVLGQLKELWGPGISWRLDESAQPHEAQYLKLDCSKAKAWLGWEPRWNLNSALGATVQWYKAYQSQQSSQGLRALTEEQIRSYQGTLTGQETLRR